MSPVLGIIASSISGSKAVTNSYESIATINLSGSNDFSFTSIPSGYTHLQLRGIWKVNGTLNIQFNGDTTSNYSRHYLTGGGATPSVSSGADTSQTNIGVGYAGGDTIIQSGIIDILDYRSTNKNKTVRFIFGQEQNSTAGYIWAINSGLWRKTPEAITSIRVFSTFNWATGSTIALYGIKGA